MRGTWRVPGSVAPHAASPRAACAQTTRGSLKPPPGPVGPGRAWGLHPQRVPVTRGFSCWMTRHRASRGGVRPDHVRCLVQAMRPLWPSSHRSLNGHSHDSASQGCGRSVCAAGARAGCTCRRRWLSPRWAGMGRASTWGCPRAWHRPRRQRFTPRRLLAWGNRHAHAPPAPATRTRHAHAPPAPLRRARRRGPKQCSCSREGPGAPPGGLKRAPPNRTGKVSSWGR